MTFAVRVALCLLLAGCASAPQVIENPVEVKVPVPVPCNVPEIAVPAWPLAAVPASASDFEFYKAALAELADRDRLRRYIGERA